MKLSARVAVVVCLFFAFTTQAQIDPSILRPAGYHPSHVAYFNTPYFANALHHGGEWYEFTGFEFGTPVDFNALPAQFVNGYPQFLEPGQKLRGFLFGLNINDPFRPAAWPARDTLAKGRIVVTWQGNADVRLVNCAFNSADSNGSETGPIGNGRRVYLCSAALQTIEVHAIQTPITDLKVWLAPFDNPATPTNENTTGTLEGNLFHPLFLQRIADADWGFIRFMDMGATNASPQQDWADRRVPGHIFMNGIITEREPSDGSDPHRETGMAYEHMVALCNATGRNMWINIPHLATDDYITRLAKLIRFGSDGVNPYDAPNANPVFPPLDGSLKVYVEFSNEIWSSGFSFPQGNWAQEQAVAAGLATDLNDFAGRARFTARKFSDTWSIFQNVFGGTSRLVRVAAVFTANMSYTEPFLEELGTYGPGLTPAVRPDVLAVTTYFGNGIQEFVHEQGFATGKLFNDPYWTSPQFATHLTTAFDEWKRRMLAGDAATGAGPDATGIGGGFSSALRDLPQETLGFPLPIIAYEGGPSLFTDHLDQNAQNGEGVPTDDGVTTFVEAMNRDPRIAEVYRIHLDIAKSKGLWTHTPYVDSSQWGRFGQWGHLENLEQAPSSAAKYALMLEHFTTFSTIRHIDTPLGAVPSFTTAASLPVGIAGTAYTQDIVTTGGTGARSIVVVGAFLDPGLSVGAAPAAGNLRISGTPTGSRKNFILARVQDADGDPAWRIFTLQTFGGPGTLVQSDFRGTSPGLNLPWTKTFVLSSNLTWSGWQAGAGANPQDDDDALAFSVSAPAEGNETLAQAMAGNELLTATVTPKAGVTLDLRGGEIRFATRRIGFHSPLGYALFTSATGFAEANALYVSSEVSKDNFDEIEHAITIPSTAAFQAVTSALEIRIYAFGAQFDGHRTSLTGFKLTEKVPEGPPAAPGSLVATATGATQVALTWTAPAGALTYQVFRRSGSGAESMIGTSGTSSFTDSAAAASTAHLYRVKALSAAGEPSGFSSGSLATTVVFTDEPLVVRSTRVRRTHLLELRTAVNAVRTLAGLAAATFTDSTITAGSTKIRTVHVSELRTALTAALTALGITPPSLSGGVAAGSPVRLTHFQELRTAVK